MNFFNRTIQRTPSQRRGKTSENKISFQNIDNFVIMSFNFDQFNNNSLVQPSSNSRASEETQIVPSGYVKIKTNDDKDIFKKTKMNLSLPSSISHLKVANDWIVILMSNQLLFRLNLKQPDKQSEVFLEKFITGQRISNMFIDPTGTHLLFSLSPKSSGYSAELMYLNKNSNKPKIVSKVRKAPKYDRIWTYNLIFHSSSEIMKSPLLDSMLRTLLSWALEIFYWEPRKDLFLKPISEVKATNSFKTIGNR